MHTQVLFMVERNGIPLNETLAVVNAVWCSNRSIEGNSVIIDIIKRAIHTITLIIPINSSDVHDLEVIVSIYGAPSVFKCAQHTIQMDDSSGYIGGDLSLNQQSVGPFTPG